MQNRFYQKRALTRSANCNLEKLSLEEHNKDLITSQIIMETHEMESPFVFLL